MKKKIPTNTKRLTSENPSDESNPPPEPIERGDKDKKITEYFRI
jgi:hypothetical protein